MEHAKTWILKYGGGVAILIILVWPCLSLPAGVFSKGYWTFWVIISIIWGLVRNPLPGSSTAGLFWTRFISRLLLLYGTNGCR